ncbi:MAG: lipoamide dehydrogenase [Candidatus Westeberhardia cardiocondylae]|nr:lipoamide dehydrogenase [Candidatus Westeberhardia cardiocondylae]
MDFHRVKTNVVVIGSGPGGYSAAFRCADLNLNTVLIEYYSSLGGVCLNVGCIPSKTLLHIVNVVEEVKKLYKCNIVNDTLNVDIDNLKKFKDNIINKLSSNLKKIADMRNVKIINGYAEFVDVHTLKVKIFNGVSYSDIFVDFDYAIIAAGSKPYKLSIFDHNDIRIWNSNDALSLKSIPKNMLIVGCGIIGLEIASIYRILGSKIDIIESSDNILSFMDCDVVNFFVKQVSGFFNIFLKTSVISVKYEKDGIYVKMKKDVLNSCSVINNCYDVVLVAVGRVPNGKLLSLEKTGVFVDSNGYIPVNKQMCTNVSNIYAIGDIVGKPMLAHKSIYEGHLAAEVIFGKKHFFHPKVIPSVVYTIPEIGCVGVTEYEAKKLGINYCVSIFPWFASGRAVASQCSNGITKLIFNKSTNKIIGGSVVGVNASELLGEITLAIEMNCDAEDISLTMHAHPTLYESISLASELYQGTITDILNINNK